MFVRLSGGIPLLNEHEATDKSLSKLISLFQCSATRRPIGVLRLSETVRRMSSERG